MAETAPPEVDATDLPDPTEVDPPEVDATDLPAEDEDETVDVFAAPGAPESPYTLEEDEWPETAKVSNPRPPNPFIAAVEALVAAGLPSPARSFVADAADESKVKGQLQRAAGDRATVKTKVTPATDADGTPIEGKIKVKFRLEKKIKRATPAGSDGTTGGAAD